MRTDAGRDLPKAGFQLLLDDIVLRLQDGTRARYALDDLLSLGGRMAVAEGLAMLTPEQIAFRSLAGDLPLQVADTACEGPDASMRRWYLGVWSYGRIYLAREFPPGDEPRLLGVIDVPATLEGPMEAHAAQCRKQWQRCDREMDAFFAACDDAELKRVLYEVHEAIDHTDPVLFYIGDATLTNFGKFNNLQERNGVDLPECFFRRAQRMSLAGWTREEKIFVFCVYWLRAAGCRGEEFGGRQLNPALLADYFDRRLATYREMLPMEMEGPSGTIAEKAELLAHCKRSFGDRILTYRAVNGLNFNKQEILCVRSLVSGATSSIPAAVGRYLKQAFGIDAAACDGLPELFDRCIAEMAASRFASGDADLHAFETLLKVIVDSAIAETGSDVGMTRGFRDLRKWQRTFAGQDWRTVCDWSSGDYYCGVFPSAALADRLLSRPELLVKILYACSGRMQFNSWHYAPGYCPRAEVPDDRHFYLPPKLPDMAVWSDQHHAGHSMAEVRFSIRAPAPIEIDGRRYPGLVDLRLYRQRGDAYSEDEFFCALRHAECLRAAVQAFADHLCRGGDSVTITAFDKDWFKRYYGRSAVMTMGAGETAVVRPATGQCAALQKPPMGELFRLLSVHAAGEQLAMIEACHQQQERPLTYRALLGHALALRDALHARGVAPGACVALWSQRPLHQAIAVVAGLACGVIVNPINPALSASMLDGQLRHAEPALLIVDADAPMAGTAATLPFVNWNDVFGRNADYSADDIARAASGMPAANDDKGGLLVYTSGTTGEPKGVLLAWRHIRANVKYAIGALGYEPGWVAGSMLPRFHTFTLISDLLPALLLGGRVVLADTFELGRAKSIVDAFRRHGVQSYSAAPVILEACCGLRAWEDVPALQFAVAGAAPLKERTRTGYGQMFGHPVIPCYGLSETTCFAAISPPDRIRPGAVGRPAGIEICVIDEMGMTAPCGASGELAMRGSSVIADGYFRDCTGRFAKAFTRDGWFLTGDIGRIDEDGYIYVTGRKKNMVIRGGEKIYLEDLDRCLAEIPGVVDCASIAHCEPGAPDLAMSFIVTADSRPVSRDEINEMVRSVLTPRHLPDRIHFIDFIPRTPSGKASHPELMARSALLHAAAEMQ